jgi:hypothetical protein
MLNHMGALITSTGHERELQLLPISDTRWRLTETAARKHAIHENKYIATFGLACIL